MLGAGNADGSTGDFPRSPYIRAPNDSGAEWIVTGPHVMIFPTDPRTLTGMPTDSKSGGPHVMWAGTPYAHIMMPVAGSRGTSSM